MIITDAAFPYLVAQQGRLDHLKHDRPAWEAAYSAKMADLLAEISPHLPARIERLLDVGGGMGGIDALIAAVRPDCEVQILDGLADPPLVTRHARTFNDLAVTEAFQRASGARRFRGRPADAPGAPEPCDLILSFGSWCFHFPPAAYLDFVIACCRPGTVLILEVRKGRPDWSAALTEAFTLTGTAGASDKFTRNVYVAA